MGQQVAGEPEGEAQTGRREEMVAVEGMAEGVGRVEILLMTCPAPRGMGGPVARAGGEAMAQMVGTAEMVATEGEVATVGASSIRETWPCVAAASQELEEQAGMAEMAAMAATEE